MQNIDNKVFVCSYKDMTLSKSGYYVYTAPMGLLGFFLIIDYYVAPMELICNYFDKEMYCRTPYI